MSVTLLDRVRQQVLQAPVLDLHTHLFAPELAGMNLSGIDELVTYHYLIAEALRVERTTPERFFAKSKPEQADLIWDALFVRRAPISEATTGVCRVLTEFGLDPCATDLRQAREFFAARDPGEHVDEVLRLSGVRYVTMTNDPLDPIERASWEQKPSIDRRFLAALRIDPIVNDWTGGVSKLNELGYDISSDQTEADLKEVRRYFDDWIKRMRARYLAISLPDDFAYPDDSPRTRLLNEAVLPTCQTHGIPFAMMIGVRRRINPRLQSAGDGVGPADLSALERLVRDHPHNRFLVTVLARENQQGLCVLARKFANLLPFGCWWFMNNPSLVEETTLMRLEMLGTSFVPQHSDARILDQLIYKWAHAKESIARALTTRYEAMTIAGRPPTGGEIKADASMLMGGQAAEWLGIEW